MATTLTVNQMHAQIGWSFVDTLAFGNSTNSNSFSSTLSLANGTGAGNASKICVIEDNTGIAGSGTVSVDLQACTDIFYNAVNFAKVKAVYIANDCATTGDLIVGNTTTAWAGTAMLMNSSLSTLRIPQGGFVFSARTDSVGWPTSATQKVLLLTNAHTSSAMPYRLIVVGE